MSIESLCGYSRP